MTPPRCVLCFTSDDDVIRFGEKFTHRGVTCHHFCLLFSPYLPQNGADAQGIEGFLLNDIKKELERCSKTVCCYCGRQGASSLCQSLLCCRTFHVSCAIRNNALLSFIGRFCVNCVDHRPQQKCAPRDASEPCSICMEPNSADMNVTICTPCCGHLFHKTCLQRMALNSAYFFTCPTCRDKNLRNGFIRHMKRFGVYIPNRDASWETLGAFSELLDRPDGCTQRYCLCVHGRKFCKTREWRLLTCIACGSSCTHIACVRPADIPSPKPRRSSSLSSSSLSSSSTGGWVCEDCTSVCGAAAEQRWRERRPSLRQLLNAGQLDGEGRPRSLAAAFGVCRLSWQLLMTCIDDPRELLKFVAVRGSGKGKASCRVEVRTRCVADPLCYGQVISSVCVPVTPEQLQPRVHLQRLANLLIPLTQRKRLDRQRRHQNRICSKDKTLEDTSECRSPTVESADIKSEACVSTAVAVPTSPALSLSLSMTPSPASVEMCESPCLDTTVTDDDFAGPSTSTGRHNEDGERRLRGGSTVFYGEGVNNRRPSRKRARRVRRPGGAGEPRGKTLKQTTLDDIFKSSALFRFRN